jgi:serine protease inhibitor
MSYRVVPIASLALVFILASCSSVSHEGGPPPLLSALPRSLSAPETLLIDAGNQFGFDLLRRAAQAQPESNILLSPLSASMALGMTLNGAAGTTLDSMRTALRLGTATLAEINAAYRSLLDLLDGLDGSSEFRIANSVWTDTGFPFLTSFLDATRTNFDAEVQSLDLQAPASLGTINNWVNSRTNGKIPTILDQISADEVMFLINAIYFKGQWRLPFDTKQTRPAPFYALHETQNVATMNLPPALHGHATSPDAEVIELLYGNGAFAMTIVLPRVGHTLAEVVSGLDAARFASWVAALQDTKFGLTLPKFRFEYTRELVDDLSALGMRVAFDGAQADFSRMANLPQGVRLFLSRVTQKTFIDVNEEGTEAAAVTAVGVGATSAPQVIAVDRPFLFVLRERLSGTIFFVGQVNRIP